MEIRQLQLFVALAEEQNFTRAANRMHIVQSGLSSSIKDLEEDLGVRLFDRTTRSVLPTEAGKIFLHHARTTLLAMNAARNSVARTDSTVRGRVRIGMLQCCSPYVPIADVLESFKDSFPQVKVGLRSLNNEQIAAAVLSGDLDIGFYALTERKVPRGLAVTPYSEDHLVAICSQAHELAGASSVTLERLSRNVLVDAINEKALREITELQFKRRGLKRMAAYEVDNPALAIDLVEKNLGVMIIQAKVAEEFGKERRIHILKLSERGQMLPKWRIVLIRRKRSRQLTEKDPVDLFLQLLEKN